jgi:hypothetical protein
MKMVLFQESLQVYVLDPWLDSSTFLYATLRPRTTIPGVVYKRMRRARARILFRAQARKCGVRRYFI